MAAALQSVKRLLLQATMLPEPNPAINSYNKRKGKVRFTRTLPFYYTISSAFRRIKYHGKQPIQLR